MDSLEEKYKALQDILASYGTVAVAFSGGVDSCLLLYVAHLVLGDNALALTAIAPMVSTQERNDAKNFCQRYGIKQEFCEPEVMTLDGVRHNTPNRCYECKKEIFTTLLGLANAHGIDTLVDGSNTDDLGDFRPGTRALKELKIKSPLLEAGLSKENIRALSRKLGLESAYKQSNACLATRFPYGTELTSEKLLLAEKAEKALADYGFSRLRVRIHGEIARIEVPLEDFEHVVKDPQREKIVSALKELGFVYVTLDLSGFRSGSMNETLEVANN